MTEKKIRMENLLRSNQDLCKVCEGEYSMLNLMYKNYYCPFKLKYTNCVTSQLEKGNSLSPVLYVCKKGGLK